MVRSRFAWLKSTKIRVPRSSFHQAVVTLSGIRRSSSRAAAITACRTSRNSWVGSTGANTCSPRLPEVLMKDSSPASDSTERSSWAAGTASSNPVPGCGSRSIRSWSGIVGVAGPRGPGVEHHRVHLHRPDRGRNLVNHELRMRAAAGIDHHHRAHEIRGAPRRVLRKELLAVDGVAEPLERHGPVAVRRQESVPDVDNVPGEVQLREPELRPQNPAGAGDPQVPRVRWGCQL